MTRRTPAEGGRFFRASRERLELLRELERREGIERRGTAGVPRRDDPADRPLSPAQERLWFLARLEPDSAALNIATGLRLRGRLDPAALAWSLSRVARRHEVLRAVFPEADGRPVQVVRPAGAVPLPVVDLSGLTGASRRSEVERLRAAVSARPFRVEEGPLFRVVLVALDPRPGVGAVWMLHWAVHHLVADGWSLGILVRELTQCYRARVDGAPVRLPEPAVEYADYARWLRNRLDRGELDGQLAFWRRRLAGAPPHLALPVDRPVRAGPGRRGGRAVRRLAAPLADRVRRLARDTEGSLFMVLLAGFGLVLGRWSGQEEVVVGSPVAGRVRREVEGVVGLFLNHLALRLDLSGAGTFRELVLRAREVALEAYDHQEVPFERILEAVAPERDLARTPVFQVYLNVQNFPIGALELPGVTVEPLGAPESAANFELELYVSEPEGPDGPIRLELAYDAERYDPWRADELLDQLEALVSRATATPDRLCGRLSLVTARARRALPDPGEALSPAWEAAVHARFDEQVRRFPDRVAVAWEGGSLSYGALAKAVGDLAGRLAGGGVAPGDIVAVRAHRSPALVAAVLAVLRAGAAFLVLDPAHPPARNALCLARARPRAWLALEAAGPVPGEEEAALERLPGTVLRLALPPLERSPTTWPGPGRAARRPNLAASGDGGPPVVGPDHPAVVAFTSGSTGDPKGVLGLHRSLTHFLPWQERALDLGPGDRFALLSGLAHDPLQRDLFTPLWTGASIAVPDGERLGEPGWVAGWMARLRVTMVHLTPALGRIVTEGVDGEGIGGSAGLRRALFVGEPLPYELAGRLRWQFPGIRITNLYGTTETQRALGWLEVEDPPEGPASQAGVVPLGQGMPDVQLLVLRPGGAGGGGAGGGGHGELAGLGEVGEIAVRSPHLAAGYLGDGALTAARFVPDPGSVGGRLYRTGDLGRFRADGSIEPLGRRDRQLSVRGFRIEPAEVEAALEGHPAIGRAAVIAAGDAPGGAGRLVAYVTPAPGLDRAHLPGHRELRRYLEERLPGPMIPAASVVLDRLPLTPGHKLDRAALPPPPAPGPGDAGELALRGGEGAADPTTELVAGLWAEVLGIDSAGPDSDFFDLGGHSLQVTRVLARVREVFGVELPVRSLFEDPTVDRFARRVEAARRGRDVPGPPPLVAAHRVAGEDLPPSFAQERLWFLHRLDPESPAYNLSRVVALQGRLELRAVLQALGRLLERHESLRTGLYDRAGRPVQRVLPPGPAFVPVVDLRRLGAGWRDTEARRVVARHRRRPFDLARPPLVRALLLRLADEEHRFGLGLHHVVTDGWSMGVLVRDLVALYRERVTDRAAGLPALPVQYPDYALWQREWLAGSILERQLAWWREHLEPLPDRLDLPADRPRPKRSSHRSRRVPVLIPAEDARRLRSLARGEGATLFMVALAAFQGLLGRWTGSLRVAVGTPVANRRDRALEDVVGFFVNTVVLAADVEPELPFRRLVGRVRRTALGAFAHQDLPFERLADELRAERDRGRPPLFQAMLAFQNVPRVAVEAAPGLRAEPVPAGGEGALFDLLVSLTEGPGGQGEPEPERALAGFMETDADLFDRSTSERLAGHLVSLVRGALADPDRALGELPLLSLAERHQALREWPRAGAAVGAGGGPETLHGAFEEQAAQRPDAVAVVQGAAVLTYGGLLRRSRELARALAVGALREPGGDSPRVGIALERSPEQIVALFGVLAAGAAYVPLDPELPAERLRLIAEDASLSAVLAGPGTPPAGLPSVPLVRLAEPGVGNGPVDRPPPAVPPDALAYVLYTSGSTGRPKGVMIPHRAAASFSRRSGRILRLDPAEHRLQVAPLSFDASVADIFPVLRRGGTLVLRNPGPVPPVSELLELCRDGRVTVLGLPTALWHELVVSGAPVPESVRQVVFGGEAGQAERVLAWRRAVGAGVGLLNAYGPTETTVAVVMGELSAPGLRLGPAGEVPIGRPGAGCRVYLTDRGGRPVPAGVAGELQVGGEVLARGYLGSPGRTAESFVPDAHSGSPGARLYRTGDLGRCLPDGTLVFTGRADRQVKVRGVRVEPGEVESALHAESGVREAVVDLWRGPGGLDVLVAWVATEGEPDGAAGAGELREGLARRLPAHAIPSLYVPVPKLPRTPSGKVDRRRLPEPDPGALRRVASGRRLAPRTGLERDLAAVWEDVLEVEGIGVLDDFFELGGHSLLAVRLAARLEDRLGSPLPIGTLFEHSTVESLAAALRREGRAPPVRLLLPLARRPATGSPGEPLVFVHPAGGSALCYGEVAAALGADRPVWALQAPGLEGEEEPLDTVEALADRYVSELEGTFGDLRAMGTVHLAGWSFGALVAFEVARRLDARGGVPGVVVAIDAAPARESAGEPGDPEDEAEPLARAFADLAPVPPEELRALDAGGRVELLMRRAEDVGGVPPGLDRRSAERFLRVFTASLRAARTYRPGPSRVRMVLLRAVDSRTLPASDPGEGWRGVARGGVEVVDVPGDHRTVLDRANAGRLALELAHALKSSRASAPRPGR